MWERCWQAVRRDQTELRINPITVLLPWYVAFCWCKMLSCLWAIQTDPDGLCHPSIDVTRENSTHDLLWKILSSALEQLSIYPLQQRIRERGRGGGQYGESGIDPTRKAYTRWQQVTLPSVYSCFTFYAYLCFATQIKNVKWCKKVSSQLCWRPFLNTAQNLLNNIFSTFSELDHE